MRIILVCIVAIGLSMAAGCSSSGQEEQPKAPATPATAPKPTTTQPVAQPAKEAGKPEHAPATQPKPLARESAPGKESAAPAKQMTSGAVPAPVNPAPVAATQPATPKPGSPIRVVIETPRGNFVVELAADKTPITVGNFLRYVDEKFYDGTIFHRVIRNFMIQGGGYTAEFQEKTTHDPITNESAQGLKNVRGTIAMARKGDPNSATSQFFINTVDNPDLDYPNHNGGYCAFGRVVDGMDAVDAISESHTVNRGQAFMNLPMPPMIIKSIHRE